MRKLATVLLGTTAALALAAGPAFAYTGTPLVDGKGFVGKGEVQTPWGWNNATLQKNATGVIFAVETSARYAQDCQKEVGGERQRRVIENTFKKTVSVSSALLGDPRQTKGQNQFTGFSLSGFMTDSQAGAVPTDLCTPGTGEGEDNNGWVPAVDELTGESSTVQLVEGSQVGGLYADHPAAFKILLVDTNPVPGV